jgi:hypothetical protein
VEPLGSGDSNDSFDEISAILIGVFHIMSFEKKQFRYEFSQILGLIRHAEPMGIRLFDNAQCIYEYNC